MIRILTISILFLCYALNTLAQVPTMEIQPFNYDDYQNEKANERKGVKSIIIKRGYLGNDWSWGIESYELDNLGRIIVEHSSKFMYDTSKMNIPIVYTYHSNGMWESKQQGEKLTSRTFAYSAKNELIEINYSDSTLSKFEYDESSRIVKAIYSTSDWTEYEYYDTLEQVKSITIYKDSTFSEKRNYLYQKSSIELTVSNVYSFMENDTTKRYVNWYYDKDTSLICREAREEYTDGYETLIENFRYENNKLVEATNYLSVQRKSGFVNYYYNTEGRVTKIETFVDNGKKKTREIIYEYVMY